MSYLPASSRQQPQQHSFTVTRDPLSDNEAIALALAVHNGQDPRSVPGYTKVRDLFIKLEESGGSQDPGAHPFVIELTRIALRAAVDSNQPDKLYALVESACRVLNYEELIAFISAAIEPAARPDETPAYSRLAGLFTRYTAIPPALRPEVVPVYEQVERLFEPARFERLADPIRGVLLEVLRRRAQLEDGPEAGHEAVSALLAARLEEIQALEKSPDDYQAYLLERGWVLAPVTEPSGEEAGPSLLMVRPEDLGSAAPPSLNGTGHPNGSLPRHERRKLAREEQKQQKKEQKRLKKQAAFPTATAVEEDGDLEGVFPSPRGKKKGVDGLGRDTYVKQMITCLEAICRHSGHRPSVVFNDWIRMVEVTLRLLPDHVKFIGETGRLPEDPDEAQQLFAEVRTRYENHYHPDGFKIIWEKFCQAFSLLLDSTAGGLWGDGAWGTDLMGPDRLGALYMLFANYDPSWNAQYFTPFNIALMMARMTIMNGEREVMERLKAACTHEDNIVGKMLAFKLLLQGIFDDNDAQQEETQQVEPEEREKREAERARQRRDMLYYEIIPAARPYYDPIRFLEPCIGSGVMMLAAASCFPAWTVHNYLVEFWGCDIDTHCVLMARVNAMLFGLNGYGLRLHAATHLALHAYFQRTQPIKKPLLPPGGDVGRNGAHTPQPIIEEDIMEGIPLEFTFQGMYREWADHQKSDIPMPVPEAVTA